MSWSSVCFDTAQVRITLAGDASGVRATASDSAWQPFCDVLAHLLRAGATGPVALAGLAVPGVAIVPKEADASEPLRAFWRTHLRAGPDARIGYWGFLRPGTDDGALMPDLALWTWLEEARSRHAAWLEEVAEHTRLQDRYRRMQAAVDREGRSIDWSAGAPVELRPSPPGPDGAPGPALLDALEDRLANFDRMHPDEPATHVSRGHVWLALAAAGLLDPPDDGLRERHLARRPTLLGWRRAALAWFEAAAANPELSPEGCSSPLASPVALDWFRPAPFAGEDHDPTAWLRWHLQSWLETPRDAPGHLDLFARALSGRVVWRSGVEGVQQLCAAGRREPDLPWAARCTVRAAVCTRARHEGVGVALAARLARAEPGNWHGWMELGVALGALSTRGFGFAIPYSVAGKPLDRFGAAGGARSAFKRAISLNGALAGASVIRELEADLEDQRIFTTAPPVPLDELPAALVDGLPASALAAALDALPSPLARYVRDPTFAW